MITPWTNDLSNFNEQLYSPDKQYKIEYEFLGEFGMGSPVSGHCSLFYVGTLRSKYCLSLSMHAGLPFAWNESSTKLAFPIWSKVGNTALSRIAMFDTKTHQLLLYKKTSFVWWIKSFKNNIILCNAFPSEDEQFNIEKEATRASIYIK